MTNRLHPRRALCLVALLSGLVGAPLMAQQAHGQHQPALEGAVASAPVAAASKPVARKPRPQMGISAALAPDGALWVVGLTPQGQLFVQHAPSFAPGAGPKWEAPRVLDTSGDPIPMARC